MLLVGGAGGVWDLPLTPKIAKIAESLAARGAIVAASSHGVTGLTFALDPSGEPLIKNRRITCINEIEVAAAGLDKVLPLLPERSAEHTSELPSLMRISYAVFCLKQTIIS